MKLARVVPVIRALGALGVLVTVACGGGGASDLDAGPTGGDGGLDSGGGGDGGGDMCGTLRATIRDFRIDHPDFEVTPAADTVIEGLVMPTITPGDPPTLAANAPAAGLITNATTFSEWYRDVAGVNQRFEQTLALDETSPGSGVYVFDSDAFFPLDGQGFGDEGNPHNYHFTTELHARFTYEGGERFTFRGDDDVWVFVNGRLAIDIGGVHSAVERTIDFDARASELGITPGTSYPIDFFHAERHVTGSNFRIETSIPCFIIF